MPQERRRPTPTGDHTGSVPDSTQGRLPRRLRRTVEQVEWRDAIAGAILGQLLDALGGDEVGAKLLALLASLLK